jgi:uncharacterized protein
MDQLKLHEARKPSLKGIAAVFLIGLVLGGVLTASWRARRAPLELAEGEVSRRSTTVVGVVRDTLEGELARLTVELRSGNGRVLISVPPYEGEDTQRSARNAKLAAEEETNFDLARVDIIFSIEAEAELVAGPSAGGAMAVLLVAAIENRGLRQDAVISAAIEEDGRLLPTGEINVKLRAVKDAGFRLFIVSADQTGLDEDAGIRVEQVRNLEELAELMLG